MTVKTAERISWVLVSVFFISLAAVWHHDRREFKLQQLAAQKTNGLFTEQGLRRQKKFAAFLVRITPSKVRFFISWAGPSDIYRYMEYKINVFQK